MLFYEYAKRGEEILNELRVHNKKVVLYGTGSIGNYIGQIIDNLVTCYCVTELTSEGNFNNLPVYRIDDLPYKPFETNIILTLDSRHWETVGKHLTTLGYSNITIATLEYQNSLLSFYYKNFFERKNINIEGEYIDFDGTLIRNPLKMNDVDFKSVLIEMNDLVLGDIYSDVSMWSEGPYQYGEVNLKSGDVVFDCGSNLGLFSCIAASKQCVSYAFEPTKRLYDDLNKCVKCYGDKIIPVNVALSDVVGTAELAISPDWDVANTIVKDNNNTIKAQQGYENYDLVETITIDEFVKKNQLKKVDFIKADIEGAERYMLKGATNTLANLAPKLAICTYHFKDDPKILEEIILEANPNYTIKHKWKKLYAYIK